MSGNKSVKESLLKRCGLVDALQRHRRSRWGRAVASSDPNRMAQLLFTEGRLRQNVQKELCVKEKIEDLRNRGAPEKEDPAEHLYRELEALTNDYWCLEREWWAHRSNFTTGPLTKAFELCRSNLRWYMHPFLREDCARRGGCCSRDCGCCSARANDSTRPLSHGHCTVKCGCCRKARGFDFTTEQKQRLDNLFSFSDGKSGRPTQYFDKFCRASIWGYTAECTSSSLR